MISALLILPLIFCVILFFAKCRILNNILINLYALLHLGVGVLYCINPETIAVNEYFSLNPSNIIFYLILSVVFLACAIYNVGYSRHFEFDNKKITRYSIMLIIFVLSMTGGFLSTNLGLAWIFIEGTTLASAYLIYFNKTKHSIEAAWKYVFMCSIGIALAFVGIILLTIATGSLNSLNYGDLIENAKYFNHFWLNVSFVLILFGIGTKMGLTPVHFWLPDAHAQAPSPISALLSATLLNCAFYVILNVYKIMIGANCLAFGRIIMLTMGFLSLFVTSVFLYHTTNYKRMLAYSSIENMGILIISAALGGIAYGAMIIHLIGHSLIKASYFLTSGNILTLYDTKRIKSIKLLDKVDKKTAWLWIMSFLGICAFPPSMLFISEFLIVKTFIIQKHFILCVIFLFLLTIILYAMGKTVFNMVYGKNKENIEKNDKVEMAKNNVKKLGVSMYLPQFIMLFSAFLFGIYIPKFLETLISGTIIGFGG